MKLLKKPTAAQAASLKALRNHELIKAMLDWDEATMHTLFIESALEYLDRQCGPDAEGIRLLREGNLFWPWFKNHWNRLDAAFIDECLGDDNLNDMRAYYKYKHTGSNMRFKPHKKIMEQSFARKEVAV